MVSLDETKRRAAGMRKKRYRNSFFSRSGSPCNAIRLSFYLLVLIEPGTINRGLYYLVHCLPHPTVIGLVRRPGSSPSPHLLFCPLFLIAFTVPTCELEHPLNLTILLCHFLSIPILLLQVGQGDWRSTCELCRWQTTRKRPSVFVFLPSLPCTPIGIERLSVVNQGAESWPSGNKSRNYKAVLLHLALC